MSKTHGAELEVEEYVGVENSLNTSGQDEDNLTRDFVEEINLVEDCSDNAEESERDKEAKGREKIRAKMNKEERDKDNG